MIKYATEQTAATVRKLWEICFNETDSYDDIYFKHKYSNENTLIYFENEQAVASLQILYYKINYYNNEIQAAYLSGICTLPEFRGNGFASKLISKAEDIIKSKNITIILLIPGDYKLINYYNNFDYEVICEKDNQIIPLKQILDDSNNLQEAYTKFNLLYDSFYVQKTFPDFVAIVEEFIDSNYETKTNQTAMAKILDFKTFIQVFCTNNPNFKNLNYFDKLKNNPRLLTQLLFGYKTKTLTNNIAEKFPEKKFCFNLMLE